MSPVFKALIVHRDVFSVCLVMDKSRVTDDGDCLGVMRAKGHRLTHCVVAGFWVPFGEGVFNASLYISGQFS